MEDASTILSLLNQHRWLAASIVVLVILAKALKSPALGSPLVKVPVRFRPHIVGALGVLSGILQAVATGKPWSVALAEGLGGAAWAIAIHGWGGGLSGPAAPAAAPTVAPELPIAPEMVPSLPADPTGPVAVPPDLTPNTTGTPRAADLDFTGDPR